MKLDASSFACLLRKCRVLSLGKLIHARLIASGLEKETYLENLLIEMYGRCGTLSASNAVFDKMNEHDVFSWAIILLTNIQCGCLQDALRIFKSTSMQNVAFWNTLISAYGRNGLEKEAIQLFHQMQLKGLMPDKVTFVTVMSFGAVSLQQAKYIHSSILLRGLQSDVIIGTVIVKMYGKFGLVKYARAVFDRISGANVVSWTTIISTYAQNRSYEEAFHIFQQMHIESILPNNVTVVTMLSACTSVAQEKHAHSFIVKHKLEGDVMVETALANLYGKYDDLQTAIATFDRILTRNVVTWSAIIAVFIQHGRHGGAFLLFHQMQLQGLAPNKVTFTSILSGFCLVKDRFLHACAINHKLSSNLVVGNALVSMYAKCGSLSDLCDVFDSMPEHNLISWTALIAAYAECGKAYEAVQIFKRMEESGMFVDTFIMSILCAGCATETALTDGARLHAITVSHGFDFDTMLGSALVDMYGKCGNLRCAATVFDSIPNRDLNSWTAIIMAFANQGSVDKVLQIFRQMMLEGVFPDSVTFVGILYACSHAGLLEEGAHLFVSMTCDLCITPSVVTYHCVIDLLGRTEFLDGAEQFIYAIPFQPSETSWKTLLAACNIYLNVEQVDHAGRTP